MLPPRPLAAVGFAAAAIGFVLVTAFMQRAFGWGGFAFAYVALALLMAVSSAVSARAGPSQATPWIACGALAYLVVFATAAMRGMVSEYMLAQAAMVAGFGLVWFDGTGPRRGLAAATAGAAIYAALFSLDSLALPAVGFVLASAGLGAAAWSSGAATEPAAAGAPA